jgi:serine/threonine protein kinase
MTEFEMAGAFLASAVNSSQDHFIMKFTDIKFDKMIGSGAAAEVYKGTYKEMDVAIKKMRFHSEAVLAPGEATSTLTKEFQREVSTLIRVRHPNLVLFQGACVDNSHVLIVTEYCFGGSLFSLLHE